MAHARLDDEAPRIDDAKIIFIQQGPGGSNIKAAASCKLLRITPASR